MPAATDFAPSFTIAWASTVAVVVPSPAVSLVLEATSRTICAPMFSNLSSSSISLATVTPSLVMRGRAERLVDDDVAALGAERHLHGVGEDVDAAQHAVARVGGKAYVFGSHWNGSPAPFGAFGSKVESEEPAGQAITPMMSDSFMIRSSSPSILTSVPDHLPNRMRSPALTSSGIELAALVAGAGADGDDFAFLRLLLGGVGNDDAALGLLLAVEATDDDAVMQGTEFHE